MTCFELNFIRLGGWQCICVIYIVRSALVDRRPRDRLRHVFIPSHSKTRCQVLPTIALIEYSIYTCRRYFEYFITLLVAIISGCFIVEMFMTEAVVAEVLEGFIPTVPSGSVYTGISLMVRGYYRIYT